MGLEYPKMCVLVAVFVGLMTLAIPGYSYEISRPIDSRPIDSRPIDSRPIDSRPIDSRPIDSRPTNRNDNCNGNVTPKPEYGDCSTNFTTLERALFETCDNHYSILTAFYPPRESVALYADVYYHFLPNEADNDTLIQHWIWTSGSFYLVQPPAVFRFTSLFFSYPEGQIHNLKITLPRECRNLTTPQSISGDDGLGMLEVLTHRFKLYAEYNSLDQIVTGSYIDINRFLGKAVPDNHQLHHIYQEGSINRGRYEIIIFFVFTLVLPFLSIAFIVVIAKGSRAQIRNKISDPKWHPTIASLTSIGFLFTAFVWGMDWCALIWAYPIGDSHHNEFGDNHHTKHYVAFVTVIVILVIDTCAFFYTWVCGFLCLVAAHYGTKFPQSYLRMRTLCTYCWFPFCFCGLFCGRNVSETPNETLMWWLLSTAVGPMMCFSNHIGYMVLGWIIYPKRGGAVFIIYVLSFFYYFMMLKRIYLAAAEKDYGGNDCCKNCGKLCKLWCRPEADNGDIEPEADNGDIEPEADNGDIEPEADNGDIEPEADNGDIEPEADNGDIEPEADNGDIELGDIELGEITEMAVLTPEKELEKHDSRYDDDTSEHHFNFLAFVCAVFSGFILGGLEALSIAAFTELPLIGVIEDTPMYMLNLFHVTVLVASIVLTYKYLTAEAPIERELLKGIIQNLTFYRNTTHPERNPTPLQQQQPPPQQPPRRLKRPRQVTEVERVAAVIAAVGYNAIKYEPPAGQQAEQPAVQPAEQPAGQPAEQRGQSVIIENLPFLKAQQGQNYSWMWTDQ